MMRKIIILLFLMSVNTYSHGLLLFKPLFSNTYEPRNGAFYQFEEDKLRLDIGASFDFVKLDVLGNKAAIGADFFTYTRLRHEGNFKFPVETSDYFFGANYSMKFDMNMPGYIRFRLAHISSHLVDGYTNADYDFIREPIVYSREFVDIVWAQYLGDFRYYVGVNFIFSTIPDDPNALTPEIGFDYSRELTSWLTFDLGFDFKLIGIDNIWQGTTVTQVGLTFWPSADYGIFTGLYCYRGRSMHGQFYREYDDYLGLGLQFIFF
jgi:hypothetical protein